ncbi:MAG: protein tyrosine phosphatase [Hyphomicrobium sp.]|nr:MAG: protein tyrosine phosphatase [Hyphomicrobium sp.]
MPIWGRDTKRALRRTTNAWRQGLAEHSPPWLRRSFGAPAKYLDMLFVDHGIFRVFYVNEHKISERAWRSAQPAPFQIRRAARNGIKTIVNLRGDRVCGSYWLERAACERAGIKLVNFQVRSRAAPTREELRGARELFDQIEYPMLMHCKSGADRVGLMSVLYRHIKEGVPISAAKDELSLRYGHFRQADTGVLDYFFERYLEDNAKSPMPFFDWVETVYDANELKRSFQSKGWANRIVDTVLRRE